MRVLKFEDLHQNQHNPRFMSKDAMERLKQSIQRDPEFMTLRPIVYGPDRVILGGNQRHRACVEMGMTEIPAGWAIEASDLTDDQQKRFGLVDNAPEGASGAWDWEILTANWTLPELSEVGFTVHDGVESATNAWEGMPEFDQTSVRPYRTMQVCFASRGDFAAFCEKTGIVVSVSTKTVWFPQPPPERTVNLRIVDGPQVPDLCDQ